MGKVFEAPRGGRSVMARYEGRKRAASADRANQLTTGRTEGASEPVGEGGEDIRDDDSRDKRDNVPAFAGQLERPRHAEPGLVGGGDGGEIGPRPGEPACVGDS